MILCSVCELAFCFFFIYTATTEIYTSVHTLSLHYVLPFFLQRQVPQAHPVLSCKLLHRAEAALELGVRPQQRAADIDLRVPRQVGTDEQDVAQLVLQPRTTRRDIGRVGHRGEFNLHLTDLPVQPFAQPEEPPRRTK